MNRPSIADEEYFLKLDEKIVDLKKQLCQHILTLVLIIIISCIPQGIFPENHYWDMEGSVKVTVNYTGTGAVYSDHNIFICFYSEQNPSSSDYLYEGVESFSANNSSEICWLYYEEIIYLRVVYYFDGSGTYTLIGQLG